VLTSFKLRVCTAVVMSVGSRAENVYGVGRGCHQCVVIEVGAMLCNIMAVHVVKLLKCC